MSEEILDLWGKLVEQNQYTIRIKNTNNNDWAIYIFRSKIQADIQTPRSLSSVKIDVPQICEYIDREDVNTDIKILYTGCYDENYEAYKNAISTILSDIVTYYEKTNRKVIYKSKFYYTE